MKTSKFTLISKIGNGSFGDIYKGINKENGKEVAIKIENIVKKGNEGQLKQENQIYKIMKNTKISIDTDWPKVYEFGTNGKGQNVLVMDLLGDNLDSLKLPLTDTYFFDTAKKMIHLIELFHEKGHIHRDLKPQNFCFGAKVLGEKSRDIFLIDYGLAKKYKLDNDDQSHIEYSMKRSLKGTIRYSSINTHLGVEQSRRDDLLSLGFILLYMAIGKLKWQNLMKIPDKESLYKKVMYLKISTSFEEMTQEIKDQRIRFALLEYLFYTFSLNFEETANYSYCKNLFKV